MLTGLVTLIKADPHQAMLYKWANQQLRGNRAVKNVLPYHHVCSIIYILTYRHTRVKAPR